MRVVKCVVVVVFLFSRVCIVCLCHTYTLLQFLTLYLCNLEFVQVCGGSKR